MDYMSPYMKALHKIKTEAKAFRSISQAIIIGSVALLMTYLMFKEFFEIVTIIIWIIFLIIVMSFKTKSTSNAKYPKDKSIVEINENFIKKSKRIVEKKNNYIEFDRRTKCPIEGKNWEIASQKCQECEQHISHKLIQDEHGRVEGYLINCKELNKNKMENQI